MKDVASMGTETVALMVLVLVVRNVSDPGTGEMALTMEQDNMRFRMTAPSWLAEK
jgi:hypothetical protein